MKSYWNITDNSTSTRLRSDLVAGHRVSSYSKAIRNEYQRQATGDALGGLLIALIVFPLRAIFYLLGIAFMALRIRYLRKKREQMLSGK